MSLIEMSGQSCIRIITVVTQSLWIIPLALLGVLLAPVRAQSTSDLPSNKKVVNRPSSGASYSLGTL